MPALRAYFSRDKIDCEIPYRVFIVEQENGLPFNRGALKNIGFLLGRDDSDYTCFHDIDYLPIWADYSWSDIPVSIVWYGAESRPVAPGRLATTVRHNLEHFYGGAVLVPNPSFGQVNGYANCYWGWGMEDEDLRKRFNASGIEMRHRKGTFRALDHDNEGFTADASPSAINNVNTLIFRERWSNQANARIHEDGLQSVDFQILSRADIPQGPLVERPARWEKVTVRLRMLPSPEQSEATAQAPSAKPGILFSGATVEHAIELHKQGRIAQAEGIYKEILARDSKDFDALHLLGLIYAQRGLLKEAESYFRQAVAVDGRMPPCLHNYGILLCKLHRYEEGIQMFRRAIEIAPNFAPVYADCGNALLKLGRHEECASAYAKALEIDPQTPFARGTLLHEKMMLCDWAKLDELIAQIERDLAAGKQSAYPFGWLGVAKSERSLQRCAEIYATSKFPGSHIPSLARPRASNQKIRVGYVSGEFRDHATSYLLAGVLESHDKDSFEIFAFDSGWDDGSRWRRRIVDCVHRVVSIRDLDTREAVKAVQDEHIDVLIDLAGYCGEQRTDLFSQKPAPIQINYLGFPGTLGAAYIDYIIADRCVIPPNNRQYYTEKVVYLPNCYQANDAARPIGTTTVSRAECGLPATGFVFCCFNNSHKITPEMFSRWMRILRAVDGGVLWLLGSNPTATVNLRKEAAARGIEPQRLVFAQRMPAADHLSRFRLADLFLDTLPYNAHTTASEALWVGVPVLTCLGETFPGRVAASLLHTMGLPGLIAPSLEAYEEIAIDLAQSPERLSAIRRTLAENRLTKPLFDTKLFTKHIEAAYTAMYERYCAGLAPDHITIPN